MGAHHYFAVLAIMILIVNLLCVDICISPLLHNASVEAGKADVNKYINSGDLLP